MWIRLFFFSLKQQVFCLSPLKLEAFALACLRVWIVTQTSILPILTFCIVRVRKIHCIWYEKRWERKEQILKIFLKWGFESSGVTPGESLTEESICLSFDPGQGADKSEFTSSISTLKDDTFEKSISQAEGYKEWQSKLKRGSVPLDCSTKPLRLLVLRSRDCVNAQERLLTKFLRCYCLATHIIWGII